MNERQRKKANTGSTWNLEALIYLVLSIVGLISTAAYNVTAALQGRDYLGDWLSSGPAVSSLGADLFIVALAGCVFIVVESRRLKMRFAWLYILASGVTAIAFTFPLFLSMRARKIGELERMH